MRWLVIIFIVMALLSCSKMRFVITDTEFPKKENQETLDFSDYWSAMCCADTVFYLKNAKSLDKKYFALGLKSVVRGDRKTAKQYFRETLNMTSNDTLKKNSSWMLKRLYEFDEQWEKAYKIRMKNYDYKDIPDSVEVFKKVSLSYQMSTIAKPEIIYSDKPDTLKMDLEYGLPTILLNVKGKEYRLLFDTGFEYTAFSDELAANLEFHHSEAKGIVQASTGIEVPSQQRNLKELKIGNCVIKNHPCSIVGKDQFYMNFFLGIITFDFHGAIGFNFMKHFDVTIDYENEIIILKKPVKKHIEKLNFFYLGYPTIRAATREGHELNFFFDSGSNTTWIQEILLSKVKFENIEESETTLHGVGGDKEFSAKVIPQFDLIIGKKLIEFENIQSHYHDRRFIAIDGIIGSNLGKGRKLHFDLTNGIFEILE